MLESYWLLRKMQKIIIKMALLSDITCRPVLESYTPLAPPIYRPIVSKRLKIRSMNICLDDSLLYRVKFSPNMTPGNAVKVIIIVRNSWNNIERPFLRAGLDFCLSCIRSWHKLKSLCKIYSSFSILWM